MTMKGLTKVGEMWRTTCEESLGRRKREKKVWITEGTLDLMADNQEDKNHLNNAKTRAAKEKYRQEYSQKHREVRRSVRTNKRCYFEELLEL